MWNHLFGAKQPYGVQPNPVIETDNAKELLRPELDQYLQTLPGELLEYCVFATRKNEFGPFKSFPGFRKRVDELESLMQTEQLAMGANNPYYVSI